MKFHPKLISFSETNLQTAHHLMEELVLGTFEEQVLFILEAIQRWALAEEAQHLNNYTLQA